MIGGIFQIRADEVYTLKSITVLYVVVSILCVPKNLPSPHISCYIGELWYERDQKAWISPLWFVVLSRK